VLFIIKIALVINIKNLLLHLNKRLITGCGMLLHSYCRQRIVSRVLRCVVLLYCIVDLLYIVHLLYVGLLDLFITSMRFHLIAHVFVNSYLSKFFYSNGDSNTKLGDSFYLELLLVIVGVITAVVVATVVVVAATVVLFVFIRCRRRR